MKKILKKISKNSNLVANSYSTNPIDTHAIPPAQNAFARKAVELFEKQTDIKKFTKFVMQDEITDEFLDNTQAELLLKDVFNPFNDESYRKLAQNQRLLDDLATDADVG